MTSKRLEHQIDDALLATAMGAGFIYVRRRIRRLISRAAVTAAATTGLGVLASAGFAAAWWRNRGQRRK
ncbi:MAG TPA: hypothetical protein VK781_03785 [Solirubrobacteraceae bacterium]|jgi:hypothetical protein|nr:hypothetical protein [Solirubrobacteraceae bacterium]